MTSGHIVVSAWSNGSPNNFTGSGYGIKVPSKYRDKYFDRNWRSVTIEFDDRPPIKVRISESFWRSCSELRSAKIGKWMLDNGIAPWPKGKPPKIKLTIIGQRRFKLSKEKF